MASYCTDMARMPFRDGSFDGVYSIYSSIGLHGAPAGPALKEAARVTRVGGTLLVDVANDPPLAAAFTERVPHGWAVVVRWRGRQQVHQLNFVASSDRLALYRLEYLLLARELPALLDTSGWSVTHLWAGFDRQVFSNRASRLVVRATRR